MAPITQQLINKTAFSGLIPIHNCSCQHDTMFRGQSDISLNRMLFLLLFMTSAEGAASEICSSEDCCLVDMPKGYCGMSLPREPMKINTTITLRSLEEINEAKHSYTINLG